MATAGGGRVLNEKIGLFENGYHFDALVIKPSTLGNLRVWPDMDTPRDILEKIVSLAQSCDIDSVWVQGKKVR